MSRLRSGKDSCVPEHELEALFERYRHAAADWFGIVLAVNMASVMRKHIAKHLTDSGTHANLGCCSKTCRTARR